MNEPLQKPTAELVKAACKEFDEKNQISEQALTELFCQYPDNRSHPGVLLKVVALNGLYATQIYAVMKVADHIHRQAQEIDSDLASGSPAVVEKIAKIEINGKARNNYSFATKYCSWHNPACYPIWDSRVARYLRSLKGSDFTRPDNWTDYRQFADYGGRAANGHWRPDNWTQYREFAVLMNRFREFYNLRSFTFKEIDKFLFLSGEELMKGDLRS